MAFAAVLAAASVAACAAAAAATRLPLLGLLGFGSLAKAAPREVAVQQRVRRDPNRATATTMTRMTIYSSDLLTSSYWLTDHWISI